MWARRNYSETFASFGSFRGDDGSDNAAHAPWAWDNGDDGGQLIGGELATDPAKLTNIYFDGLFPFTEVYRFNGYQEITCDFPNNC